MRVHFGYTRGYILGTSKMTDNIKIKQSDVLKLPTGKHFVDKGLYLLVRNDGSSRSWVYKRTVNGQVLTRGLGSAYEVTLRQVKAAAEKIHAENLNGVPTRQTDVIKKFRKFSQHYAEAIEARRQTAQWRNVKHTNQWYSTIRTYVLPIIGDKNLAEITPENILEVLEPIWYTKSDTAEKIRQRLKVIFDYFIRQGWRDKSNPAAWDGNLEFNLPSIKKVHTVKHHIAASIAEIRKAVPKLMELKGGQATLFGILTATRCEEFCDALWSEIDFKKRLWTIPPSRRKDGKPEDYIVPLSRQAIDLLQSLDRKKAAIFPGRIATFINRETPRITLQRAIQRDMPKNAKIVNGKKPRFKVTMHGCRSTFRDWAAEAGKDYVTSEKCLMHKVGNEVTSAYLRSDLIKRRRQLLQQWADMVMKTYEGRQQKALKDCVTTNSAVNSPAIGSNA